MGDSDREYVDLATAKSTIEISDDGKLVAAYVRDGCFHDGEPRYTWAIVACKCENAKADSMYPRIADDGSVKHEWCNSVHFTNMDSPPAIPAIFYDGGRLIGDSEVRRLNSECPRCHCYHRWGDPESL